MAKVEENLAKITPRQLQDELMGVNMIALSGVPMVLRYKDFLNKKLDEKVPSRIKKMKKHCKRFLKFLRIKTRQASINLLLKEAQNGF